MLSQDKLTVDDVEFLAGDYESFAETSLLIRTKSDGVTRFVFNNEQQYLEHEANKMLEETGMVRLLVPKARQTGVSTWAGGRFYHKVSHELGKRVSIITHRDDATTNLFKVVKLFHDGVPDELQPETGASNTKTLELKDVGSSYTVATAGSGTVGRSDTIQYLHGSEVAYWENTQKLSSGIMQTVPEEDGTEIILESTGNGPGNMFHRMCMNALKGKGQYRVAFIPWFWHVKYRKKPPKDFILTDKELEYKELYDLDDAQMYYRRCKIDDFDGGEWQFKQEYPAIIQEVFELSGEDSYIPSILVTRARLTEPPKYNNAPILIGVDPAGEGEDTIGICVREGRVVTQCYEMKKNWAFEDITMQIVDHVIQLKKDLKPSRILVGKLGLGIGVCDELWRRGLRQELARVVESEKMADGEFLNRRAYMWGKMKEWLKDDPCVLPDDDRLHAELTGFQWSFTTNKEIRLEENHSKRRKESGLYSPGMATALALTFAYPIIADNRAVDRYRSEGGYAKKQEAKHWMNA